MKNMRKAAKKVTQLLVQKCLRGKNLSKSFSAILRLKMQKKVPMTTKLVGRGRAGLCSRATSGGSFFAAFLSKVQTKVNRALHNIINQYQKRPKSFPPVTIIGYRL